LIQALANHTRTNRATHSLSLEADAAVLTTCVPVAACRAKSLHANNDRRLSRATFLTSLLRNMDAATVATTCTESLVTRIDISPAARFATFPMLARRRTITAICTKALMAYFYFGFPLTAIFARSAAVCTRSAAKTTLRAITFNAHGLKFGMAFFARRGVHIAAETTIGAKAFGANGNVTPVTSLARRDEALLDLRHRHHHVLLRTHDFDTRLRLVHVLDPDSDVMLALERIHVRTTRAYDCTRGGSRDVEHHSVR